MNRSNSYLRIFLSGDVMIGRGIDQALANPSSPELYEPYVRDARGYLQLAEQINGKIITPVSMAYIWGDALQIWQEFQPTFKIINLETAITTSNDYWPGKYIHYRMHPGNLEVLATAGIDICILANNHILDWGYLGLLETINSLKEAKLLFAGAGENISLAMSPTISSLEQFKKRILVFACCDQSSGVPPEWAATSNFPGVYFLSDLSTATVNSISKHIEQFRKPDDLVILSIHWGSNWGYEIPDSFRQFAHGLIDTGQVDLIHGHSSHHPRSIEIYQEKAIFYGCGDFINDYESISTYERFRHDLSFMYFLDFDSQSLSLKRITLVPMQIKNFCLHLTNQADCSFLLEKINYSASFNAKFKYTDNFFIHER